ncbi:MAG: hypothetical protein RBR71_03985 [Gudongella sp.]|nr:hypothetical protein [Gudongella sp.]
MNFYDKLKDFLYDSVDYLFMIGILVVVVGVIGWRLDVLFEKETVSAQPTEQVVVDNSSREDFSDIIITDKSPQEEPEISEEPEVSEEPEQFPTNPTPSETPPPSVETIKIIIPDGSMPGNIGLILQENGLITSSRDFIAKAVELKLDTKLKSGSYTMNKSMSLDDIVQMMTK